MNMPIVAGQQPGADAGEGRGGSGADMTSVNIVVAMTKLDRHGRGSSGSSPTTKRCPREACPFVPLEPVPVPS